MANNNRMGPPEAYGQPPRTGRFWFDMLAAMAAIVISVVSLVVSVRGEKTQHGLLAENAWPFLQLSKEFGKDEIKLDVENAGVGPAKIYNFEVLYQNRVVMSARDLMHRCCDLPEGASASLGYGSVYGNVLRPGEHILALRIGNKPETAEIFRKFRDTAKDITFRACYCSILDACWISALQTLDQAQVSACPAGARQFELDEKTGPF